MQGLKVLPTVVDEIARVNEIVDRHKDRWKTRRLCCTMPAGATKIDEICPLAIPNQISISMHISSLVKIH